MDGEKEKKQEKIQKEEWKTEGRKEGRRAEKIYQPLIDADKYGWRKRKEARKEDISAADKR